MNGKWRLTFRQSQLFAKLMEIDANWDKEDVKNIIGTEERKDIMKALLVNKNNLSFYLKTFKENKLIIEHKRNKWIVNPVFMPAFDENGQMTITHILNKIEE